MSKILTFKEAEEIATKMVEQYGFSPVKIKYDSSDVLWQRVQICNVISETKTTGMWWWKKTVKTERLEPLIKGDSHEDVLSKLDTLLSGPSGQGRADQADKLRKKLAVLALDEQLQKDMKEAVEFLDKELQKD